MMGLRAKTIWFIITIVVIPFLVAAAVFFTFLASLFEDADQASQFEESFYIIEQEIYENYSLIEEDKELFFERVQPFLVENQLKLEINNLEGESIFNSDAFIQMEEFQGTLQLFQQYNKYTISIFQNNKKEANAIIEATPLSPPAFTVNATFFLAVLAGIGSGVASFILLITGFSLYLSKNVLTPLEKLDRGMQYVGEGDYSFDLKKIPANELGRLTLSFKEMREKLRVSLEKQESYEQARNELIASISHDLRTPLASIQGYIEALKEGVAEDEEQRRRYMRVIEDKSKQLNRLIEDLFEFSKLELDQFQLKTVPMDSSWLSEIFAGVELDSRRLKIQLEIEEEIRSVSLLLDPQRLIQVIMNLVQNAARYIDKEEGKVWITTEQRNDWFIIKVSDNGKGISELDLPFLFDRFYRTEKSRSSKHGGAGLGLAISKAILQAHNGKIKVDSKLGEGSTFSLYLPIMNKKD